MLNTQQFQGFCSISCILCLKVVFTFRLITADLLKRAAKITPETLYVLNVSQRTVTSDSDVMAFEPITKLLHFIKFFSPLCGNWLLR